MVLAKFIPEMPFAEWRFYLLRCGPWTEYSLYYTFLESYNLFEKYHFLLDNKLSGNSFWYRKEYESWDPANSYLGIRTFYFSVLQSNTGVDPDEIWQKVRPYLRQEAISKLVSVQTPIAISYVKKFTHVCFICFLFSYKSY